MWERTRDCMMTPSKLRPIIGWATIFFIFNVPVFTALCFVLNTEQLQLLSLIYISEISILAMVAGLGSWWQSLRVEEHQAEDADVQEVLDVVTGKTPAPSADDGSPDSR